MMKQEFNIFKEIGSNWLICSIFVPLIINKFFDMKDLNFTLIATLGSLCVFLYLRARHFFLLGQELGEADRATLHRLFEIFDVNDFEENIYQQNAWYGYRITSIDRAIHFVEEADRVGNMITHEGIKRRLNSLKVLLKDFLDYSSKQMYNERTSYTLPKEPDKYSQSEATAIVLNEKTKKIFQELEKFVFNLKKEHQFIF